jgi:hypothetical protein
MVTLAIRISIANSCTRCRWIFKELSQNWGLTDSFENLHASLDLLDLLLARSITGVHLGKVSDPYSFDTDLDLGFYDQKLEKEKITAE